ncbi:MAG: CPBP family intramembrane metalloprotease [Clostridia bacterium]|jgi:membrane protease YdiL (CAAX protease family)|nr:CPBP family intramembrane metalloprotease [Clostridia bacterium]
MDEDKKKRVSQRIIAVLLSILQVVAFVVGYFAVCLVVFFVFSLFGFDYDANPEIGSMISEVVLLIALFAFLFIPKNPYKKIVKLKKAKPVMYLLAGVVSLGMLGFTNVYFGIITYLSQSNEAIGKLIEEYSNQMDSQVSEPSYLKVLLYAVVVIVAVPVFEELLFRGMILGSFRKSMPQGIAIVLAALSFGFMHSGAVQIIYASICGIALGCVYAFTEDIRCSILAHAIFNYFGTTVTSILLDNKTFGISDGVSEAIQMQIFMVEISFILPAIICLVIMYSLYNSNAKNLKIKQEHDVAIENIEGDALISE